jgi:hypothetical protein
MARTEIDLTSWIVVVFEASMYAQLQAVVAVDFVGRVPVSL